MKKIFALTTIVVLLAVVIPASAAPPNPKPCDFWLGLLEKIPPKSPNYQNIVDKVEQTCDGEALDHLALVALYESTDGENWYNNSGWLVAEDHCAWYGVSCDIEGEHVLRIDLSANFLNGSIPPEIGYLSNLQKLDINDSWDLSGSIPPEFGYLTQLEFVSLQTVSLGGPIPETLLDLTQLTDFYISSTDPSLCISDELFDFFSALDHYRIPELCLQ